MSENTKPRDAGEEAIGPHAAQDIQEAAAQEEQEYDKTIRW